MLIPVTKINGDEYYINPDMIEYMEMLPGTILCLTNGKRLNILETPEQVIERIVEYRRRLLAPNLPQVYDNSGLYDEECED